MTVFERFPKPWSVEFRKDGGYDCMTDAWDVCDMRGSVVVSVDLSAFGQQRCHEASAAVLDESRALAEALAKVGQ